MNQPCTVNGCKFKATVEAIQCNPRSSADREENNIKFCLTHYYGSNLALPDADSDMLVINETEYHNQIEQLRPLMISLYDKIMEEVDLEIEDQERENIKLKKIATIEKSSGNKKEREVLWNTKPKELIENSEEVTLTKAKQYEDINVSGDEFSSFSFSTSVEIPVETPRRKSAAYLYIVLKKRLREKNEKEIAEKSLDVEKNVYKRLVEDPLTKYELETIEVDEEKQQDLFKEVKQKYNEKMRSIMNRFKASNECEFVEKVFSSNYEELNNLLF
eukprot:maker-scaffold_9-snap-gene-11.14-mRNA-1 protein AED:0.00 eAED:0.00 QI:170/1/1/1/1/1/3/104/273